MQKPTIGRIVHFVWMRDETTDSGDQAAIITHVWSDTCINLCVFSPNGETKGETSVVYSDTRSSRSWHWPEKV